MSAPSVVVCTFRHGRDLLDALQSLDADADPAAELVLVRSGVPADAPLPPALAEWLEARARPVKVIAQPELGVSVAKATGLDAAATDVVLFIDDDVVVHPGWYRAMAAALATGAAAVGGTILPAWPDRAPRWLHPRLAPYYGERFPGAFNEHLPFGANFGLRRDAVAAVGGMRPDLGMLGTLPGMHEETELCERLLLAGYRVQDVPEAVVEHCVRPDQVRLRWVLRRAWAEGRADARRDGWVRAEAALRAAKLAGLLLAWPVAALERRRRSYVTARILVNAGYAWELAATRRRDAAAR